MIRQYCRGAKQQNSNEWAMIHKMFVVAKLRVCGHNVAMTPIVADVAAQETQLVMLNHFARFLSYGCGLAAGMMLLRKQRGRGVIALTITNSFAAALSPLTLYLGLAAASLGWRQRDGQAVWWGLGAAVISWRYIRQVTQPHDGLARAFGRDWQSRVPDSRQAQMLRHRRPWWRLPNPRARWQRDLHLGTGSNDQPLRADLWRALPAAPASGIGLIYLHGSGWNSSNKDVGTRPFFRYLANQGHVILDVAYSLAPQTDLAGMIADVKRAVAWLKTEGAAYGVNPRRIVLMGGSAGAHLALLAAYTPNNPAWQPADIPIDTSVCGVISFYGIPDLISQDRHLRQMMAHLPQQETAATQRFNQRWPKMAPPPGQKYMGPARLVANLMGGEAADMPAAYAAGSPINHVGPHCPPTLIFQGESDPFVCAADAGRLYQALQNAGVPAVYVSLPQTSHAFDLIAPRWSPAARSALYDTERFLAALL